MKGYLLHGLCGLLLGLVLRWTGLAHPRGLRLALGLRRSYTLRSALTAVGWGLVLIAALAWLAVLDVDTITVIALHGGALIGGVLFGVAAALCGYTPLTAFAGLGGPERGYGGQAVEALCTLAGCFAVLWLLPSLDGPIAALAALPPHVEATLFRITLDKPFLLEGGFLGHVCLGLVLIAAAMCIPSPRVRMVDDEEIAERAAAIPPPEAAPAETFVAVLPGEEPLVVDTALDGEEVPDPLQASVPEPEAAAAETFAAVLPGEEPLVVDTVLDGEATQPSPAMTASAPAGEDTPPDTAPPKEVAAPDVPSSLQKKPARTGPAGPAHTRERGSRRKKKRKANKG